MSSLFRSGKTVPKGYAVSIKSWENDGDDYQTNHFMGIESKNEVEQLLYVAKWFSHMSDDMGNDPIQHEEILSRLHEAHIDDIISFEFIKKYIDIDMVSKDCTDEEWDNWLDLMVESKCYDKVEDFVRSICGCAISYDYDFARMVESIDVYYFDNDIHIPAPPPPLHTFNCDYGAPNVEWKI